jgi:hypothetical protein
MTQKILIGGFAVDSGQAMIGDPCYLEDWKPWNSEVDNFEDHPQHAGEYGYLGACNATLEKGYGDLGNGFGVVFNTGYGDGYYPVYAEIDENNRVVSITVNFVGDDEGDE